MIIGLTGKANTGKSTFMKAATLAEVEIADYPFTTIKPNFGVGYVKVKCIEEKFNVKCQPKFGYCLNGYRFVPVEMIDVAGLVPEAHLGKGRGNEFLSDLNQADVLVHIVDVSGGTNERGEIVEVGSYDISNDIRFLEVELDMWYLGILKKGWERFVRQVQQEKKEIHKALASQLSGLKVDENMVKDSIRELKLSLRLLEWNNNDLLRLSSELRKKSKPMIIACNKIDVEGANENFARLQNEFPDYVFIACSAESELALREAAKHNLIKYIPGENEFEIIGKLNDKQKNGLDFIKENVVKKFGSTGIQKVLDEAVFDLLKYIIVYPVESGSKLSDKSGKILPDAHLLKDGSTALDLAFKIHTDIGNKFVKAIDVKTKKVIGKESKLKNGDVVEIITS